MLGLAIGDALGMPFEFSNYNQIKGSGWNGDFLDKISGNPLWNLNAGQWTDDTHMALCIARSLVDKNDFVKEDVIANYLQWFKSGDLRGIGVTCERALSSIMSGNDIAKAKARPSFRRVGVKDTESDFCGNGTVMRIAPIGLFFRNDLDKLDEAARTDANITHNHPDARDANVFLARLIACIANGSTNFLIKGFTDVFSYSKYEYDHVSKSIANAIALAENYLNGKILLEDVHHVIETRGTAHETLGSAMFCILSTNNFTDAVCNAVFLGGDTDSRAAITGAIAGTLYGLEGIPKKYIDGVEASAELQDLDIKLFKSRASV